MSNEKIPLPEVVVRRSAIEDNDDGSVTLKLIVTQVSAGRTFEGIFSNVNVVPVGEWSVPVSFPSREEAESWAGVGEAIKEVVNIVIDTQNILLLVESDEERGQAPPDDVAAEWDQIQRGF